MPSNVKDAFITNYRAQVTGVLEGMTEALALKVQYDALNYSGSLVDGDLVGLNAGITAQEFKDAVAAIEALRTSFDAQRTNLFKVRK